MPKAMAIGTHLASLNLFAEADGTFEITISGFSPAFRKTWDDSVAAPPAPYVTPNAMLEGLIVDAAQRMANRRH